MTAIAVHIFSDTLKTYNTYKHTNKSIGLGLFPLNETTIFMNRCLVNLQ